MDGADGSSNFRDGHDLGKEEKVICVRTESAENIIDDGYEWKKYGQKRIRDRIHPRYYFRCRRSGCLVKKQVERCPDDHEYVLTTYTGIHNHIVTDFLSSAYLPRNSYDLRAQVIDLARDRPQR